jgi:hypothetical protein
MNFIRKILRKYTIWAFKKLGLNVQKTSSKNLDFTGASKLLEFDYGHLASKIKQVAIDGNNEPIPWFTYPSIEYFRQLDLTDKIMLEWGAGNSSLFFSKKVKKLYSIEHNKEWYEQVENNKIDNQILVYADSDYAKKPKDFNIFFDIILIDGIKREDCSIVARSLIAKGGVIILDNSDRHPDIAKYFRDKGFIEVDFHGLGPINDYAWTTSIFMDRNISFNPLTIQPTIPIGGGF